MSERDVRQVLHLLMQHKVDEVIRNAATRAEYLFSMGDATAAYMLLYEYAELYNPFWTTKRSRKIYNRQKCLNKADERNYRCVVAQLFYELAEGLYAQTPYVNQVMRARFPVVLTQEAA